MAHARSSDPPSLRLLRPEDTARRLRVHFARHNLRVLLFTTITLLSAAALWIVLYGVCCWLLVLGAAAIEIPLTRIPYEFRIVFAVAALCAVIYAWIDRRLTPNERPDDKRAGDVVADFLLAIPRMTLAVGGTLAAWQRLSADDLAQAAAFLHRLLEKKRLPMSGVRLEIPDPAAAVRILFALQITQVIDAHRDDNEFWLKLSPLRPESLHLSRGAYADA
jgi:hypothetical protein